jgi:hypothetical protein
MFRGSTGVDLMTDVTVHACSCQPSSTRSRSGVDVELVATDHPEALEARPWEGDAKDLTRRW